MLIGELLGSERKSQPWSVLQKDVRGGSPADDSGNEILADVCGGSDLGERRFTVNRDNLKYVPFGKDEQRGLLKVVLDIDISGVSFLMLVVGTDDIHQARTIRRRLWLQLSGRGGSLLPLSEPCGALDLRVSGEDDW